MSKRLFSKSEQQLLASNPNVKRVSEKSITYMPEFKVVAVKLYLADMTATEIFIEAGFDLELIGRRTPIRSLQRWRTTYKKYGEEGLLRDTRGKHPGGRPRKRSMTDTEKLKKAEAKIKYLEAELYFLKKLDELERRVKK